MKTQVDRHRRFDGRRQSPRQARIEQYAHGLTEPRDDHRLPRAHLHQARHGRRDEYA
jgi:hypothetical protein